MTEIKTVPERSHFGYTYDMKQAGNIMENATEKTTLPGIGEVQGTLVKAKSSTSGEVEVEFEDGTKVRFRPDILNGFRTNQYTPDGNPVYAFQLSMTIISLQVPEELRQKKAE